MGYYTTASGEYSTAMGDSTIASGYCSTAMGSFYTTASGNTSTAIGLGTTASGDASTAMGDSTNAWGYGSTAIGYSTAAWGYISTAMGHGSSASGAYSTAMGLGTNAYSYGSLALGRNNVVSYASGGDTQWIETDPVLEIGNGADRETPSNAVTILKNGELRAAGVIQSKAGVRVPPLGDLSMGEFTSGSNPADLDPTLGLRYPTE